MNRFRSIYKALLDNIFTNNGTIPNASFPLAPGLANGILLSTDAARAKQAQWRTTQPFKPYPLEFYEPGKAPDVIVTLVKMATGIADHIDYDFRGTTKDPGQWLAPVPRLRTVLKALREVKARELDDTAAQPNAVVALQNERLKIQPAKLPLLTQGADPAGGWFIEEEASVKRFITFPGVAENLKKERDELEEEEQPVYLDPKHIPEIKTLSKKAMENNATIWNKTQPELRIAEPYGHNPQATAYLLKHHRHPAAAANTQQSVDDVYADFHFGPGRVPDWKTSKEKYYGEGRKGRKTDYFPAIDDKGYVLPQDKGLDAAFRRMEYEEDAAAPAANPEAAKYRARFVPGQYEALQQHGQVLDGMTKVRRRGAPPPSMIPMPPATYEQPTIRG
jgi:hypothetical protein